MPGVHIDGIARHLDVGSPYPEADEGQGFGCSPIKRVRELGSNRQSKLILLISLAASDSNIGMKNRLISVKTTTYDLQPGREGNTEEAG